MFKIYVLKLLIIIVRFLMDEKIRSTGSQYEFVSENSLLIKVTDYIRGRETNE